MSEPFNFLKAMDITWPALGKSVSVVVKGLAVLAVIVGIGFGIWFLYCTIIKPHTNPVPTTTQNADTIKNNYDYLQPKAFFGGGVSLKVYQYREKQQRQEKENVNSTGDPLHGDS
ncbi:MAG TPA: hypothetical protein P5110_06915 [Candidatus Omnitrophota bacterium]|nr:hypothetical protein [Candidatus Omnitrophota bacterium]